MSIHELNPLTFFAHMHMQATNEGSKVPYWLCVEESQREGLVNQALQWLNEELNPIIPFDYSTCVSWVRKQIPSVIVDQWIAEELEAKRLREEEHKPSAFFV